MPLYEANYRRLMSLVPALRVVQAPTTLLLGRLPRIHLSVLECCRYTHTAVLAHHLGGQGGWLTDLVLKIRIYHDAQLAEVIAYQNQSRFEPFYPYPNEKMRHPFEKRRVNAFLGEWLRHWARGAGAARSCQGAVGL